MALKKTLKKSCQGPGPHGLNAHCFPSSTILLLSAVIQHYSNSEFHTSIRLKWMRCCYYKYHPDRSVIPAGTMQTQQETLPALQEHVLPEHCMAKPRTKFSNRTWAIPFLAFHLFHQQSILPLKDNKQHIQNASMKGLRAACLNHSNFAGKCTSLLTHEANHKLGNSWLEKYRG